MNNDDKTLIIAEAGVNHNGSMDLAHQLVDAAVDAGADAVKFQSFIAESLVTVDAKKAQYQVVQTGGNETQFEMLRKLELSHAQQRELSQYCDKHEIKFFSTPFESSSLRFLTKEIGMSTIKIGSGELTNAPFLFEIAKSAEQIIISTGMADLEEVQAALEVIAFGFIGSTTVAPSTAEFSSALKSSTGANAISSRVTLLQCTTDYPTSPQDINLRAMLTMRDRFNCRVGLSDHSQGIHIAIGAVALGATVIEKHLTLSRNLQGPDHQASIEPGEFKTLVANIRDMEMAMGSVTKKPTKTELLNRAIARKSIIAARQIAAGENLTTENLVIKRPGIGTSPFEYWNLLGTRAARSYNKDELI